MQHLDSGVLPNGDLHEDVRAGLRELKRLHTHNVETERVELGSLEQMLHSTRITVAEVIARRVGETGWLIGPATYDDDTPPQDYYERVTQEPVHWTRPFSHIQFVYYRDDGARVDCVVTVHHPRVVPGAVPPTIEDDDGEP